ncbi:GNAT family N-acetyltransferase [Celeribacter indicus]|uniref:Acetyl transferase n=1 Tax=Celeribacter indicus TaxID=1208324 RepID=A0A0B5DNU9_9RHOB|nr:GNAT family N-acetyltransferase [Celeribacter indicus]AJE45263.1 acetyl transferase [Celeribacter indicus]SDX21268.1 Acetyltransferase (GNAT) family protein [Celeribacter indicus]
MSEQIGATRHFAAFEATWPSARQAPCGPFIWRDGAGGGRRVSAATLEGVFSETDLDRIESRFAAAGRTPLFQVRQGQDAFDRVLERRGYRIGDPSLCLAADLAILPDADPEAGFACWPPIAVQREIWEAGGIDAARLGVMERVEGPKTALLARHEERPCGAAFVAVAQHIAVVHALEVPQAERRRGIARRLVASAAHWARGAGARTLALQVTAENAAARALYSSLGMHEVGRYHYRTKI